MFSGTPSPLLTPDHSIKPLFEDDMAKLSPDVSNFSDLSTPSRGKQRLKIDVSKMRKGTFLSKAFFVTLFIRLGYDC